MKVVGEAYFVQMRTCLGEDCMGLLETVDWVEKEGGLGDVVDLGRV